MRILRRLAPSWPRWGSPFVDEKKDPNRSVRPQQAAGRDDGLRGKGEDEGAAGGIEIAAESVAGHSDWTKPQLDAVRIVLLSQGSACR